MTTKKKNSVYEKIHYKKKNSKDQMGKRGGVIVTSRYIESKDIPMGKNGAILNLN
jgi:hypothetical protein